MIRPADREDLPAMVALLQQLFAIEADFVCDETRQRRGLSLLLDCPTAAVLVAEVAGAVVGMATGQLVISTAEGGPALLVEDVVVQPSRQGQGIGTSLLEAMARWGAGHDARRMQLLADRTNQPALQYYGRRNWQHTRLICLRKYAHEAEG